MKGGHTPTIFAFYYNRTSQDNAASNRTSFAKRLPLFVVGFLGMAVLRSIGDAGLQARGYAFGLWDSSTWTGLYTFVKTGAGNLLVVALAGIGLSTDFRTFRGLGLKPFFVGLGAALAVGVVSFVAITLLGSLITL